LSWDGTEDTAGGNTHTLEHYLGPASLTFSTTFVAVQACIELLQSQIEMRIPVLLPITAPLSLLAPVIRARCGPILVDINPNTLQYDVDSLQTVIDGLTADGMTPLVILWQLGGFPVPDDVRALVAGLPTICVTGTPPQSLPADDWCSFYVYDLTSVIGTGAVLYHKYAKELQVLKNFRESLDINLVPMLDTKARERLSADHGFRDEIHRKQSEIYLSKLQGLAFFKEVSPHQSYFIVRVENALRVAVRLYDESGVESSCLINPLHKNDTIGAMYDEHPEYPGVDQVANKVLALPTHSGVEVSSLCDFLLGVINSD